MKLVLQASHGFYVRNLLDTSLLPLLKARFEIVILADPTDAPHFAADYADDRVTVEAVAIRPRRIEPLLEFVRKRIVVKPSRAVTTSVFTEQERLTHPLYFGTLRLLNRVLGRSRLVRRLWLTFERLCVPGTEYDPVLRAHGPAVVVSANYGTDTSTIRLLRAARRLRIPTVAIVPSFDNLTSKGVIGAPMTRMLVWNETMRREAQDLHDIPPEGVVATGPVQFDVYADRSRWADINTVWRGFGLDPQRPTFVVGTITPAYFPYNTDVVEIIAEAILAGRLPREGQILVRLHPQVVDDKVYGDDLQSYRDLAARFPFVKLNVPTVRRWGKLRPPAKDDMSILAALLAHATAVVAPASTIAIDAAAVGTPVVGTAFDGKTKQPPEKSVERMFYFTHYQPISSSGAITIVRSPEELIDALNLNTRDRSLNATGRQKLISMLIGEHDGHAAERIAAEIEALATRSPQAVNC